MPGLARSTRLFLFTRNRGLTPILLFWGLTPIFGAHGEDLMQVYRDAQRYDAVYAAARQTLAAGRERLPPGRALLLPNTQVTPQPPTPRTDFRTRQPA